MLDPEGYGEQMPLRAEAQFVRASLREMMALMTRCDVYICNDSGPMRIDDALGVPLVGIFTRRNPVSHRPFGENQLFAGRGTGQYLVTYPTREEVIAAEKQIASGRSSTAHAQVAIQPVDR